VVVVDAEAEVGHDLADPVVADAAGGVPCRGQRGGVESPCDADQVAVDAPVLETGEHLDGSGAVLLGEQAEVEWVREHEQVPRASSQGAGSRKAWRR
jgi:hypothetical protein